MLEVKTLNLGFNNADTSVYMRENLAVRLIYQRTIINCY